MRIPEGEKGLGSSYIDGLLIKIVAVLNVILYYLSKKAVRIQLNLEVEKMFKSGSRELNLAQKNVCESLEN